MGVYECFSISGFIKIAESFAVFTCLMLHRIGYIGKQVFFGASDMQLDVDDVVWPQEVDAEILGQGAVMAFTVITPLILLAYAIEGRKTIQSTSLDYIFCAVAAVLLIAAGGMSCFAWNNANFGNKLLHRRVLESAGALAILTTLTGVLYLIDFFYVYYQNTKYINNRD